MLALLFQIVGIAVVVVLIVVLLAVLWFILKFRSAMRELKKAGGMLGAFDGERRVSRPVRIHVVARGSAAPLPEADVAVLHAAGFARLGSFTAQEMPSLVMDAWRRADGALAAWCSLGAAAPPWFDVTATFPDDTTLTVSNASMAGLMEQPPWKESARLAPPAGIDALLAEFTTRLRGRVPKAVPAEGFVTEFERAYAREMEWRALSGTSDEVLRRIAAAGGMAEPDERTMMLARAAERDWAVDALDTIARDRLLPLARLTPVEWEHLRERAVVVTDRLRGDEVDARMPSCDEPEGDDDEEEDDSANQPPLDPFAVLAWWNGRAPAAQRLQVAARIDQPLRAELWLPTDRGSSAAG